MASGNEIITMQVSLKQRSDIDTEITSGRVRKRTISNRTVLSLGRVGGPGRYNVLATPGGLTPAGE